MRDEIRRPAHACHFMPRHTQGQRSLLNLQSNVVHVRRIARLLEERIDVCAVAFKGLRAVALQRPDVVCMRQKPVSLCQCPLIHRPTLLVDTQMAASRTCTGDSHPAIGWRPVEPSASPSLHAGHRLVQCTTTSPANAGSHRVQVCTGCAYHTRQDAACKSRLEHQQQLQLDVMARVRSLGSVEARQCPHALMSSMRLGSLSAYCSSAACVSFSSASSASSS